MYVRLSFLYALCVSRLLAQLKRVTQWQIHTIGVAGRMFRLTLSGMVISVGGRLTAQATCMLSLYRIGQWIIPLLYISTAGMYGRQGYATTEALPTTRPRGEAVGLGNALR